MSRPSEPLEARAAAKGVFTLLLLGLGAVALLVGAVGIANVMVISVLERRSRSASGARSARRAGTSRSSSSPSRCSWPAIGGAAGAVLGALATAVWSVVQQQPVVVPPESLAGGIVAAVTIGAIAGLYPAVRASRLSPTEALRAV